MNQNVDGIIIYLKISSYIFDWLQTAFRLVNEISGFLQPVIAINLSSVAI
jgi:hypothetical protein